MHHRKPLANNLSPHPPRPITFPPPLHYRDRKKGKRPNVKNCTPSSFFAHKSPNQTNSTYDWVLDSFPESHAIWYMSTNNYTSANSPHWLHTIWSLSVILVLLGSQRRRGVGVGAVSETLAGWHFDFIRSRAEARSHLMPGAVSNGRPPWPRTLNDKIDEKHCRCCRGCSFTSCYQHCRWSSDHNSLLGITDTL